MIELSYLALFIIISLSAGLGAFVMALVAGGKTREDECYYCPFPCEHNK